MVLQHREQALIIDEKRHRVMLESSLCPECGQAMVSGQEIRRAEVEIREASGYSGNLSLRMSPLIHRRLADRAQENNRSLNGEIIDILQRAVGVTGPELMAEARRLEREEEPEEKEPRRSRKRSTDRAV